MSVYSLLGDHRLLLDDGAMNSDREEGREQRTHLICRLYVKA